jgi:hypothetical protein
MSEGNDDNWKMPKPVFRSSSGSLPKSFEETISQSFSPDTDTVEMDENDDILSIMDDVPTEPADRSDLAEASETAQAEHETIPKGEAEPAASRSFAGIFILIALLAAAIVAGLYYYFTNSQTPDIN